MKHRWVLIALVSALVGTLIGPSVVHAAAKLVTIEGAGSNNKAKVTGKGALKIDTEASVQEGLLNTFAVTVPFGFPPFLQGDLNQVSPAELGIVTNVVLDLPSGQSSFTLTLTDDVGEIWQGTVDGNARHLGDAFDNGLVWLGDLRATVTGTGGEYVVYGVPLTGARAALSKQHRDALHKLKRFFSEE